MLTRSKSQRGEGILEQIDPDIGKRRVVQKLTMSGPNAGENTKTKMSEEQFQQAFLTMQQILGELYEDKKARDVASSSKASKKDKGKGKDDKPPSPPSSPSSSSSSSSSSNEESEMDKKSKKTSLLKLDVKFELPVYDGEMNPEKLDNWIKQLEVYSRIQNISKDKTKIQLATLRMGGTTLIWLESKT